jgi:Fe-S-cluster containining protein
MLALDDESQEGRQSGIDISKRSAMREVASVKKVSTSKRFCSECPALCCKNLSMRIGKPANRSEVEDLKWQLHFDTVSVYIRNNRWYQLVEGRCMYLSDDDRCTIYPQRPDMCRRHNPPECEFFGDFYDIIIKTPEELEGHLNGRRRQSQ